jgi:hypothetical protein
MRWIILLTAAVCSAQPAPEKAAVTGRVVSAATGAPLKKAAVWLEIFTAARVNNAPTVPAVTTDAEGRFTVQGIDPGSYFLLAKRTGYLEQGYGAAAPDSVGPPLELAPGETKRDLVFKLTPQSLVYGKVLDEDGDPVPNAQVEVSRVSYARGRRDLVAAGMAETQDDGGFVVGNLKPGRYYLCAALPHVMESPGPERHIKTYFPSAAHANDAEPVDVAAGAEVRGLAIRLRKSRVFRIRGRAVLGADSSPAGGVSLTLLPGNRGVKTLDDGRFEIEGVAPGSYSLMTAPGSVVTARIPLTVTEENLDGVVLTAGPGATIDGKLRGAMAARVAVVPIGQAFEYGAEVMAGPPRGAFELPNLLPVTYALEVDALPGDSYVKSVTFRGRPVVDWQLDLTAGAGGDLVIDVSPDGGQITGKVDQPGVLVQIWPAGGESARSVKSDARGEFHFGSLAPGDYRVLAWQDLDDDLAQYAPFRAHFDADAVKVHTGEKGRERVEPRVIPHDAIAAEVARLK